MNQPSSFAAIVIFAFNRREMGQPAFVVCAAASNRARSAPGTFATTSRWISVTVQPASSRSIVKAAAVAIESGVRPPWPNSADSAIEKQPACAAAINSSGFVPRPFSKRVLNEYCVSARTPLCVERVPLPSFNPPRQTADAVRFIILRLILTGVRRNEKKDASQRLTETFGARSHYPCRPRLCGSGNSFGAAEGVRLVGLRENGLVHRETPSAREKKGKEPRQINESKFAGVFAAERQLVHEEKRDAKIDRQNERSQARNQSDGQQRCAENLSERREAKADRVAQTDRVGELRRHLGKAFQLREAVTEKNRQTEPQPQCKQSKVRQQRVL